MENEILNSLDQIKLLLVIILIIVTLLLVGKIVRLISRLILKLTTYRENAFIHLASKHYYNEEYEELVEYCNEKIESWGNNPYPLYWLARAKYKLGELETAEELFNRVKDVEPEWLTSIEPHLAKINQALTMRSTSPIKRKSMGRT